MSRRNPHMSPERVRRLLDQYGGDPARFPATERADAEAALAADPALRAQQQEARALDDLLGLSTIAPPSPDLRRRVAEIPLRDPREPWFSWNLGAALASPWSLLRMTLAGAMTAALGVTSGVLTHERSPSDGTAVVAADLSAGFSAWDELAPLAFADDLTLSELDEEASP